MRDIREARNGPILVRTTVGNTKLLFKFTSHDEAGYASDDSTRHLALVLRTVDDDDRRTLTTEASLASPQPNPPPPPTPLPFHEGQFHALSKNITALSLSTPSPPPPSPHTFNSYAAANGPRTQNHARHSPCLGFK